MRHRQAHEVPLQRKDRPRLPIDHARQQGGLPTVAPATTARSHRSHFVGLRATRLHAIARRRLDDGIRTAATDPRALSQWQGSIDPPAIPIQSNPIREMLTHRDRHRTPSIHSAILQPTTLLQVAMLRRSSKYARRIDQLDTRAASLTSPTVARCRMHSLWS